MVKKTKPRSKITRSGARRLGDEYQDVVALDIVLDWLEHSSRYLWIKVEADDAGALDDVTAMRRDGGLVFKQVKFSTDPDSSDDPWTWEKLLQRDLGKDRKPKQSLLQKWSESLGKVSSPGQEIDAAVLSNRRPASDLELSIGTHGIASLDRIADANVRQKIADQLGGLEGAQDFLARFRFELNLPNLDDFEEGLKRRFYRLGGSERGWLSLKEEMRRWVIYRGEPSPDGSIKLADVKTAASWYRLQSLPQGFVIPHDYVLPSREFHDDVVRRLDSRQSDTLVVWASPGLGKSTYSSYLFQELKERRIPVVRHHYFLSVSDRSRAFRLDHQRAAESLMHDLRQDHAKALGDLAEKNANPNGDDLRTWVEACGEFYAKKKKLLVVIVDGLDHVWREKHSVDELERLLRLILPAPDGVVVFLATQPVDESMLPNSLLRAAPRERWLQLPALDEQATEEWLGHHRGELNDPDNGEVDDDHFLRLVGALHRRSKGHPLHLRYTLKAIQERRLPITESSIEGLPECPHEDITTYYQELWRGLSSDGREILHLLTACRFPWPRQGILQCQDPQSQRQSQVIAALGQVGHLLVLGDLGLQPFHNSLLVFVERTSEHVTYAVTQKHRALEWLSSRAPEHWAWSYSWLLSADLGNSRPLQDGPNREWAVTALADRRSRREIEDILSRALWCALEGGDLPRGIELGLLRQYVSIAYEYSGHVLGKLLLPQLLIEDDPILRAKLRSETADLSDVELRMLAEAEVKNGNRDNLRRCFHELWERLRGRRLRRSLWAQPHWRERVTPFLQVAALPEGPQVKPILHLIARNRDNGLSGTMMNTYAQGLRASQDAKRLRDALTMERDAQSTSSDKENLGTGESSYLADDERSIVLQQALLLALEEGTNRDSIARDHYTDPIAMIYSALRKIVGFDLGEVRFPDPSHLSIERYEYHDRSDAVAGFFERVFFCLLANRLWSRGDRNTTWLASLTGHSWPFGFVRQLDRVTSELAGMLLGGCPPAYGWFYERLAQFRRPKFRGNDNFSEYSYSTTAARVSLSLSLDVLALGRSIGGRTVIERSDLETAFASGYCHRESWIELYLSRRRTWLASNALNWLLRDGADQLETSIDQFTERADRFTELASLAAIHGRHDEARANILRAGANLLAHGNHKDMLFVSVLDSVQAYHQEETGGSGEGLANSPARAWILQLAPAIAAIEKYTDGDETGHLPRELADALAEIAPDLLPGYYCWLFDIEDYYDALHAFQVFVKTADLSHPVAQAVARTAVDEGCLRALAERAKGDERARLALDSLLDYLGPQAVPDEKSERNSSYESPGTQEDPPEPAVFPPDRLPEFLSAVRNRYLDREECLGRWVDHWNSVGRGEEVFERIVEAIRQGAYTGDYDAVYDLAVSVQGSDKAYPWLVRAHREKIGWSQYYAREEPSIKRWTILRERYQDRWFDFLRNTLTRNDILIKYTPAMESDVEPWRSVGIDHNSFYRIVKYCLFMGQGELAKQVVNTIVHRSLDMVSPLKLNRPGWVPIPQEEQ